jgi:hypothetical protein
MNRKMKAFLILLLVIAAAVSVVAYGRVNVATTFVSQTREAAEPTALLLSGSALLAVASALRRLV